MREGWPLQREAVPVAPRWAPGPIPQDRNMALTWSIGAPGRIRTRVPLLRRQPLCPAELQAPASHSAGRRSRDGHRERTARGVKAGLSWPTHSGHDVAGRTLGLYRPRTLPAARPGAEVSMIAMLGGVLSALTG